MKYVLCLNLVVVLSLLMNVVDAALTDDLIGLYEFEDNFVDTSGEGNGNHGTPVNNPGFTTGLIGQAMSLTGVQDYMTLDPTTLTDLNFGTNVDFTMSMWIRQDDFASDPAVLSNKDWNDGNNVGINWAPKGNGIFDLNTVGSTGARRDLDTAANSSALTVGQWNLVLMSVDRDGATELYINGTNTGTIPVTSTGSFNGTLPWNIGQDGTGTYGVEFTGAVDELAIWRRTLSASEAAQIWNGGSGIDLGSQITESSLKLVVDRGTGSMTIENNTGVDQDLVGYQITSTAGAFNQTGWTSVAGRLDAAGDGSIDVDDNWLVATSPNSVSDLSEISLGTGTLLAGESIELGYGTWAKFYEEASDVVFQYSDGVGDNLTSGLVRFEGGAGSTASFGDLDFDGDLDSADWLKLQANFGSAVASLSEAQRYRLSDLNNDGIHTLDDILEFQVSYDNVNGLGSFQAMLSGATVPEPETFVLLILAGVALCVRKRRKVMLAFALMSLFLTTGRLEAATLYAENFDSVSLGPNVDEGVTGSNVWTNVPPTNWTIDNSNLPGGGVTEWRGWSFADPAWWSQTAADQNRSQFTKGSGAIAVADPDEWDDIARDPGFYETYLKSPNISVSGLAADIVQLRFDSSWRPEDTQTAVVRVSFDGGADVEILRWTSVNGDSDFKADDTNETVVIPVNNPAGAVNMQVEFGMFDAGNDWWWALDNIEVFTPLTLQVDVQSGAMTLLGDTTVSIKGYEINSPLQSLAPAGWLTGNLDAQNVGSSLPASADFDGSNLVDGGDLTTWRNAFNSSAAADADGDGDSDGFDFMRWQRELGLTGDPGSTWTTFLGTDNQLIEAYLFGSSTFASNISLGTGYDTGVDARDLVFTYTTDTNEKMLGVVQYVNLPSTTSAIVPEPTALTLLLLGTLSLLDRRS